MSVFTNPASRSAEGATAYTAAVLGLLGGRDPLEVLQTTPHAIEVALAGLTDEQLVRPEAPGKWSMRDVVQHMADSELVWGYRLRMVLAHDRPAITGYDQDLWADRLRYADVDPATSFRELISFRRSNLRLLARTPAADLDRIGVHAERGEESVRHMMRMYAGHDLLHLNQLRRIRQAVAPEQA